VLFLDVYIGLQNPQKLWRIGAALLTLFTAARLVAQFAHERYRGDWPLALAAAAGSSSATRRRLLASFGSVNLPMARMNAAT
jgi:hypothetical protein